MGQYHKIVNLTKKQYIHAHDLGGGLKAYEQVGYPDSPSTALFMLLTCSNNRGGGDFPPHSLIGTWAGDKIAVIGDYSEPGDIEGVDAKLVYKTINESDEYTNISPQVRDMLSTMMKNW
jgi:hypothetical protein